MSRIKGLISKIRYPLAFLKFKRYGKNILLSKHGVFVSADKLSLGNNIFINEKFHISAWDFTIGNNVMIGSSFTAICNDHKYDRVGQTMFSYAKEKDLKGIHIENDVWIGTNVTILKGVRVHEGAIIGAGSIVTNDVAPYTISFGNPCYFHKKRFSNNSDLLSHLDEINSKYTFSAIEYIWKEKGVL